VVGVARAHEDVGQPIPIDVARRRDRPARPIVRGLARELGVRGGERACPRDRAVDQVDCARPHGRLVVFRSADQQIVVPIAIHVSRRSDGLAGQIVVGLAGKRGIGVRQVHHSRNRTVHEVGGAGPVAAVDVLEGSDEHIVVPVAIHVARARHRYAGVVTRGALQLGVRGEQVDMGARAFLDACTVTVHPVTGVLDGEQGDEPVRIVAVTLADGQGVPVRIEILVCQWKQLPLQQLSADQVEGDERRRR